MKKKFLVSFVLVACLGFLGVRSAFAASLSQASIRYDRMQTSTLTGAQILIVPKSVGTSEIKITFGTGIT
jgi:hypothetical protein